MSQELNHILVVEDSKMFAQALKGLIEKEGPFQVHLAYTMAEAVALLDNAKFPFLMALLDLNLPDAGHGEVVDELLNRKIPSAVFSGDFSEENREDILSKGVIDYILKESPASLDFVVRLVRRIYRNQSIKTLVVDDSRSAQAHFKALLERHLYQVLLASDGEEALKVLEANPEIKLALVDYNMPGMDGFQLIKKIREKHRDDDLAVIGVSAYGNNVLSAKFIKNGANDFINKPFLVEEFYCRANLSIRHIEQVQALKEAAVRDFMTGLHNRRYLFDAGANLMAAADREQLTLTAAMLDIDYFKKVNDTYGHDAGDEVIKRVGKALTAHFRSADIVARMGGEEFCVLGINLNPDKIQEIFDGLRKKVEADVIEWDGRQIKVTISIGVISKVTKSLEGCLSKADAMLYQAKNGGRNRVVVYPEE